MTQSLKVRILKHSKNCRNGRNSGIEDAIEIIAVWQY